MSVKEKELQIKEDELETKSGHHTPEGLFTKPTEDIVDGLLKDANGDEELALRRITFYINRAGDGLSNKTAVHAAKRELEKKVEAKMEAKKSQIHDMLSEYFKEAYNTMFEDDTVDFFDKDALKKAFDKKTQSDKGEEEKKAKKSKDGEKGEKEKKLPSYKSIDFLVDNGINPYWQISMPRQALYFAPYDKIMSLKDVYPDGSLGMISWKDGKVQGTTDEDGNFTSEIIKITPEEFKDALEDEKNSKVVNNFDRHYYDLDTIVDIIANGDELYNAWIDRFYNEHKDDYGLDKPRSWKTHKAFKQFWDTLSNYEKSTYAKSVSDKYGLATKDPRRGMQVGKIRFKKSPQRLNGKVVQGDMASILQAAPKQNMTAKDVDIANKNQHAQLQLDTIEKMVYGFNSWCFGDDISQRSLSDLVPYLKFLFFDKPTSKSKPKEEYIEKFTNMWLKYFYNLYMKDYMVSRWKEEHGDKPYEELIGYYDNGAANMQPTKEFYDFEESLEKEYEDYNREKYNEEATKLGKLFASCKALKDSGKDYRDAPEYSKYGISKNQDEIDKFNSKFTKDCLDQYQDYYNKINSGELSADTQPPVISHVVKDIDNAEPKSEKDIVKKWLDKFKIDDKYVNEPIKDQSGTEWVIDKAIESHNDINPVRFQLTYTDNPEFKITLKPQDLYDLIRRYNKKDESLEEAYFNSRKMAQPTITDYNALYSYLEQNGIDPKFCRGAKLFGDLGQVWRITGYNLSDPDKPLIAIQSFEQPEELINGVNKVMSHKVPLEVIQKWVQKPINQNSKIEWDDIMLDPFQRQKAKANEPDPERKPMKIKNFDKVAARAKHGVM